MKTVQYLYRQLHCNSVFPQLPLHMLVYHLMQVRTLIVSEISLLLHMSGARRPFPVRSPFTVDWAQICVTCNWFPFFLLHKLFLHLIPILLLVLSEIFFLLRMFFSKTTSYQKVPIHSQLGTIPCYNQQFPCLLLHKVVLHLMLVFLLLLSEISLLLHMFQSKQTIHRKVPTHNQLDKNLKQLKDSLSLKNFY